MKILVTEAKKYCAESEKGTSGATSCSVLGTYFESRKNYSESNETWSGSCDRKDKMSCSLLIVSKQATAVQKESAYHTICKTKSNLICPRDTNIDRKYGKKRKNFLTLAEGLVKSSQDLLTSFLEEQK